MTPPIPSTALSLRVEPGTPCRSLWCLKCNCFTKHELQGRTGEKVYVCKCGETFKYLALAHLPEKWL